MASYIGGDIPTAYVESVGIGDALPSLPIFLSETRYIPRPAGSDLPGGLGGLPRHAQGAHRADGAVSEIICVCWGMNEQSAPS